MVGNSEDSDSENGASDDCGRMTSTNSQQCNMGRLSSAYGPSSTTQEKPSPSKFLSR